MRRTALIAPFLVAGGLLGCSPAQYFAQPANVEETRDTVRAMKEEQAAMARKVQALEAALNAQNERTAERDANLRAELSSLSQALEEISGRLDDLGQQVQRRARQAPPPSYAPPTVVPPTEPVPYPEDDGGAPAAPAPVPGASAPEAAPSAQAADLYDRAYRDVSQGNYDLAIQGFRDFLARHPADPLADNAQYWLGECHYVQDQVTEAVREFEKVLANHPGGDKVPAAKLKLGYCALRQNDGARARRWFDDILANHPASDEARSARNKLASLE
jgi:tol-pal system protein YbgF